MMFDWESMEERLLRFMKISPKKKLEWFRQMNEFNAKFLLKKTQKIQQRLRDMH